MSLLPLLFDDNFWGPSYPYHQRLTNDLSENFVTPLAVAQALLSQERMKSNREFSNLNCALHQPSRSFVTVDKNKFQANFDVQHFKPDEIIVKVTGENTITIEAKHEEKQDEHGHVYRHFVRKYVLPKNCDVGKLESRLSSDGVLTISAPTIGETAEYKTIPITQTGKPARSTEDRKSAGDQKTN